MLATTKTCTRCMTSKDATEFVKRSKSRDGLGPWCKLCHGRYAKTQYHAGDKARIRRNMASVIDRYRAYIWSVLTASSCVDCGESDPLVLEFDHIDPTTKHMHIADMRYHSVERTKGEVEKCEVVCANCHKRRTMKRGSHWRAQFAANGNCQVPFVQTRDPLKKSHRRRVRGD